MPGDRYWSPPEPATTVATLGSGDAPPLSREGRRIAAEAIDYEWHPLVPIGRRPLVPIAVRSISGGQRAGVPVEDRVERGGFLLEFVPNANHRTVDVDQSGEVVERPRGP
jgi:hypothetical protein